MELKKDLFSFIVVINLVIFIAISEGMFNRILAEWKYFPACGLLAIITYVFYLLLVKQK